MKCYVCDTDLTEENVTDEHILLNAIGGRLRSKRLICRGCNSDFGSRIDDKLSQQLQPIATLLDVKRHRGEPPNVKGTNKNKDILIEPGGKLKLARAYTEKNDNMFHIEASSERQVREVLKGLKRKHPHINIDEQIKNAKRSKSYSPSVTINMNFGGEETSRAICKMAVNFFIYNGGKPKEIKHLLPYIKGSEEEAEVYFYYPKSEVFYKDEKEVLHTLILVGDPQQKQLYVYVELFNEFKMVVFINKEYEGDPIYQSYHYNVVTNEVVKYEEPVKIPAQQLKRYKSKNIDAKKFQERMKHILQRVDKIIVNKRISDITTNAIKEMNEKYPQEENPVFTKEMSRFLADKVAKELVLSFQHRFVREVN
ncbi:HNH endonuclease [Bacillus atrophaeus]|uniref:HNH endonuclease n=1 Tax=Bacillus atrophaeus TaxID=1452 RepID=UPI001C63B639|nr:HNH endonuclease [Bacillus atrophaeus]MCY8489352.1 HNH endonuclease [Bacillus atrophaeus]MCY8816758.1 HNH endonuclease [Bacillus atrophaeus]MED4805817.1 HNH endonuclease [Bacillus atrophaeus]MED4817597.1 HNH endonuclease [Bacillus atrophaeus]MED4825762.1 HNH endonuclease [Bacillus atrophaeus]